VLVAHQLLALRHVGGIERAVTALRRRILRAQRPQWVGFPKSRRQSGPDRSVSNDLLTGPWVRPVAAYAGVATVSLAGFLQAQNGAAGQQRA
jgi:hypothetical protein